MPLPAPPLDPRTASNLVEETLARVPVHTPEWTNFNASDPGVTLVQLFAFLTDSLIFRTNQIPERNRAKFLKLLGIALQPAQAARGLVQISNRQGAPITQTLAADQLLLAGELPFRTQQGLDVLPVDARLFTRRAVAPSPDVEAYYQLLYASYGQKIGQLSLYQTVPFEPGLGPLDLAGTIDRTLWIGLFARENDAPGPDPADPWAQLRDTLGNRTLSFGLAPAEMVDTRTIGPAAATGTPDALEFAVARPAPDGSLLFAEGRPAPDWRQLAARADFDPTREPGIIEITLPPPAQLKLWNNLEPLEAGVGDLPPALPDTALAGRLISWIRVRASAGADVRLRWAGINSVAVRQLESISAEDLGEGDGTPDQQRMLAKSPVIGGSVAIASIAADGTQTDWTAVDDLLAAAPEVPVPGTALPLDMAPATAFLVDPEAGTISFGDGFAGQRPRRGERLYARYDVCAGAGGNVGAGAIKAGPLLPGGMVATNPLPTWGGADPESLARGEKQIQRMVQHRDRLVTADDFRSIAWRTPGVAIGRIDVLPAWHPDLSPTGIGAVPGVVTLMAAPRFDALHPAAPRADGPFLDALCRWLDPRRLVTTELILKGPIYKGIWISVGIEVAGGHATAEVVEAVRQRLMAHLSPLPPAGSDFASTDGPLYGPAVDPALRGWPLGKAVNARALLAEAARVPGVVAVANVLLAAGDGPASETVPISGIELPEVLGLSVVSGDPVDLAPLRGDLGSGAGNVRPGLPLLPVPIVAETC